MPKELIRNGIPDDQPFEMVVGWNRDMDVQVGIKVREPRTSSEPSDLLQRLFESSYTLKSLGAMLRHNVKALDELQQESTYVDGQPRPTDQGERDIELAQVILAEMGKVIAPYSDSIWWHPTRLGVNNLIRTLRKARDGAFGKDE